MSAYINYDDLARLEYGRILWRNPRNREQLIRHWTHARHPYRERFLENRALVEKLLASRPEDDSIFGERIDSAGYELACCDAGNSAGFRLILVMCPFPTP
jgi:hypothetical protein